MNLVEIEGQLIAILNASKDWIPQARLAELLDLARAGEPGVALEIFCTQLFELDVALPRDIWEQLRRLGREMGTDDKYCGWLAPRVRDK